MAELQFVTRTLGAFSSFRGTVEISDSSVTVASISRLIRVVLNYREVDGLC